ncbi:MAG TPA: ATP-binding protein [Myxococcaceae bacterium]|jgi:signal transduction histidine kinase
MGAIWLALDSQLQRRVAIKLMPSQGNASEEARRLFEQEAKAIAQIRSPHVVQLHDYGVDGDTPYIVMELLAGEDLAARLRRHGWLTPAAAALLLNQAAKGLSAAHAAGSSTATSNRPTSSWPSKNRADSIVNGMLLHSRTARGEPMETELNPLVDRHVMLAYQGMRGTIPGFEVMVEKELDPSLPRVEVAQQDIARVVLNLANNALHAAHGSKRAREDAARVRVATRALGDRVEIRVWDNGDGIPAAIQDKVFEPFFTTKPAGQGTGLGLSLSHDIVVQGHGGRLRFETREGGPTDSSSSCRGTVRAAARGWS